MKTFLIVAVAVLALVKPLAIAIQNHVESEESVAAIMADLNARHAVRFAEARP